MLSYNKAYILGSGFSKSVCPGMQTIKDLNDQLIESTQSEYKELKDYHLNNIALSGGALDSFESLCHLVLSKPFFRNKAEELQYKVLESQLINFISFKLNSSDFAVRDDFKEDLISFLESNCYSASGPNEHRNGLIISFNYDLLLEKLLYTEKNAVWNIDYGIPLQSYSQTKLTSPEDSCPLIFEYHKLHGSFNWFLAPSSQVISLNNVYKVDLEDESGRLIHLNDTPLFVPMSFSKLKFLSGSFFNSLWNKTLSCLELTDEINFIGYGFPSSDIDYLELFLKYREKIKDIVVYDDKSYQRLKGIFPTSRIIKDDGKDYIRSLNK
ncbi:hypothetical protein [Spirochaeta cellobiosiphila]|uniref:hypothetical protein n=1 Tax=Spirochaeta cellobiosiphila TaxID=504483 RepID=UPI000413E225|nr:hypothetical protein [Spirochaeta cellobiosiphila]